MYKIGLEFLEVVLEKIFYFELDFCIVGSYNKNNKRTGRQSRGDGGVLVVGGSVLLEYIKRMVDSYVS